MQIAAMLRGELVDSAQPPQSVLTEVRLCAYAIVSEIYPKRLLVIMHFRSVIRILYSDLPHF